MTPPAALMPRCTTSRACLGTPRTAVSQEQELVRQEPLATGSASRRLGQGSVRDRDRDSKQVAARCRMVWVCTMSLPGKQSWDSGTREKGAGSCLTSTRTTQTALHVFAPAPDDQSSALKEAVVFSGRPDNGPRTGQA